jgi:predicted nucleic acid-binding protein
VTLFVDTSVWYAAADAGDRSNGRAKEILSSGGHLVTSDHVLIETWLLIRGRIHRYAADEFFDGLLGGVARIETVAAGDLEVARAIGHGFPDQDFSIVDRTSFAVMQRLGVHRAATFDADFAVYRFGTRRDRAFTIVK